MTDNDTYTDGADRLGLIEDHLYGILSELDADEMKTQDRIRVERACQEIHSVFGGEGPEDIYRDLHTDTNRTEENND